jgi:conjugative transfer region lipoprotein (TIGR03751 family)
LVAGCASTKEDVFDQSNMKTMKQIYNEHFGRTQDININPSLREEESAVETIEDGETLDSQNGSPQKGDYATDVTNYTRDSGNELSIVFPELGNPMLVMFVYPHITESNLPVPGYSTSFRMFEKTPFAMPGESVE